MTTNFEKWVETMVNQYADDPSVLIKLFGDTHIGYNFKTQKISTARCHPEDIFDSDIGIAIAYARCKGYKVPKKPVYKKLSEMKNGDRFIYRKETVLHFIGKYPFLKDMYVMLNNSGTTYVLADEEFEMVD